MPSLLRFLLVSALAFPVLAASTTGATFEFGSECTPSAWTVRCDGQPVLVYAYSPRTYKAYVRELRLPGGRDILRDAPHDHLHHHALMYAIRVNGLNFWEETSGSGVQKPVHTTDPVLDKTSGGLPRAQLTQTLHWLAPQDAFLPDNPALALLVEERTLTLVADPKDKQLTLEWHSLFKPGGKTNTVVLTGSSYFGLGVRFRQELDPVAAHYLGGELLPLPETTQVIRRAPWGAVSFDLPGDPTILVIAGHPSNARGDAHYFCMARPFAYLSATQGLEAEPLTYKAGEQFELKYLVVARPDKTVTPALKGVIEQWRTRP